MAVSLPLLTRSHGAHIRELLLDRQVRAQDGAFVVEGAHPVRDVLTRYPDQVLMLVFSDSYLLKEKSGERLVPLSPSTRQYSCPDFQFSKLSDLDAPQGVLAVVRQPIWDEETVLSQTTILGICGEHLQDPTNVGAIIRTAAALNASGLWLTQESVDVYHPKVVRATSGVLLALPIFTVKNVLGLTQRGCQIFAAEVAGEGIISIDEIHRVPQKLVLAVGNESRGLSLEIRQQAKTRFTIPLSREVESLNVAATVAIATFFSRGSPKKNDQSSLTRRILS